MDLIQNKNNTLPQQVEENRKNIIIIGNEIFIINPRGEWNSDTLYKKGDLVYVTVDNVDYTFACMQENTNIEPLVYDNYKNYWYRWGGVDGITPTINATAESVSADTPASVEKTGSDSNFTFKFYIPRGLTGATGATGATPNIQIGTITTLQPNQQAYVTITGTPESPVFNFGIPKGNTGEQGVTPEFSIGSVTASDDQTASVTIDNTQPEHPILNFVLPKGNTGSTGATGATPVLTIGSVVTLNAGESAYVTITGTPEYPVLTFGIPRGQAGINSAIVYDTDVAGDSNSTYSTSFLNAFAENVLGGIDSLQGTLESILQGNTTVPNATNATNVSTYINGVAIADIFESDGKTVKNTGFSGAIGNSSSRLINSALIGKWLFVNFPESQLVGDNTISYIVSKYIYILSDYVNNATGYNVCSFTGNMSYDTTNNTVSFDKYTGIISGQIGDRELTFTKERVTMNLQSQTVTVQTLSTAIQFSTLLIS